MNMNCKLILQEDANVPLNLLTRPDLTIDQWLQHRFRNIPDSMIGSIVGVSTPAAVAFLSGIIRNCRNGRRRESTGLTSALKRLRIMELRPTGIIAFPKLICRIPGARPLESRRTTNAGRILSRKRIRNGSFPAGGPRGSGIWLIPVSGCTNWLFCGN